MKTVEETRRARLNMLVKRYGGMADLCEALGYARKETAGLTRIANANLRHDRGGQPYVMGGPVARRIEETLGLETGWMDTPPGDDYLPTDERIRHMVKVMEAMPEWQLDQATKIIDTIAEPAPKHSNGD